MNNASISIVLSRNLYLAPALCGLSDELVACNGFHKQTNIYITVTQHLDKLSSFSSRSSFNMTYVASSLMVFNLIFINDLRKRCSDIYHTLAASACQAMIFGLSAFHCALVEFFSLHRTKQPQWRHLYLQHQSSMKSQLSSALRTSFMF